MWFTEAVKWDLVLARRWRSPQHINVGELRAATCWFKIFCRSLGPQRCRVLSITDSMVANGVLSRGRASPWLLNQEARRRMAWEGLTGSIFCSAWVGTDFQPCDSGTRVNQHGVLSLEKPIFMRHRIVLEVFSGVAGITAACRQSGLEVADPWDILYGPQFNLMVDKHQRKLFRILESGHVYMIWFGTPCTSFTVARSPVRDPSDLCQPVPGLSARDFDLFESGSALADFTAKAIVIAHLSSTYVVLENPFSSSLWRYPSIVRALTSVGAQYVRTVYCAWGEPWVKPTCIAGTLPKLETLRRDCSSRNGICQHSGCAHRVLRGKASNGVWWTKIAEPYPKAFCGAVADLVHDDQCATGLISA